MSQTSRPNPKEQAASLYRQALELYKKKDYKSSLDNALVAFTLDSNNEYIFYILGLSSFQLGETYQAINDLQHAISISEKKKTPHAIFYFSRALAYLSAQSLPNLADEKEQNNLGLGKIDLIAAITYSLPKTRVRRAAVDSLTSRFPDNNNLIKFFKKQKKVTQKITLPSAYSNQTLYSHEFCRVPTSSIEIDESLPMISPPIIRLANIPIVRAPKRNQFDFFTQVITGQLTNPVDTECKAPKITPPPIPHYQLDRQRILASKFSALKSDLAVNLWSFAVSYLFIAKLAGDNQIATKTAFFILARALFGATNDEAEVKGCSNEISKLTPQLQQNDVERMNKFMSEMWHKNISGLTQEEPPQLKL
jgi:tetratricopeptide (TPR) repeat protein